MKKTRSYFLLLALSCCTFLSADEPILIQDMQGIVLVGSAAQMLEEDDLQSAEELRAIDVEIPGGISKLQKTLAQKFFHRTLAADQLPEIKKTIANYFTEHGYPFVAVSIPPQELTSQYIQVVVITGKLGSIQVQGNKWTSCERVLNYIKVEKGECINEKRLLKNISFINRSPFRRVDVIYAPGKEEGATDLTLLVEDRRPFRVYAGTDNTGIKSTGQERWYAGFNYGNMFGLDHIFSYQYTTSSDFHKFQAHTVQYTAYLSWQHILNIYGGYSSVHPHLHFHLTKHHGYSGQGSLRYTVPLSQGQSLTHDLTFGGDFKRTNNTVEFAELFEVFGKNVNLTQLVVDYSGDYQKRRYKIDYDLRLFWSPGKWLPDQSNFDYESLRPGAKNKWVYGRAMLKYFQRIFGEWSFSFLAEGQLSDQNLLPCEQFALGGYDTVRGYVQNQLNTDNGFLLSGELRTPVMKLFSCKKAKNGLQFLAFLDYGYGRDHSAIPGLPKHQYLMGIGPGLRYTIDPYLTFRFDWGIKLHNNSLFSGGPTHVHFALVGSY